MTQKKAQAQPMTPYLFDHIFRNFISRFWYNNLKPEILNVQKIYNIDSRPKLSSLFEIFPRSNNFYKEIISDLAEITEYDRTICLNYLFVAIGDIASGRPSKPFDAINRDLSSIPNTKDNFIYEFISCLEKLLLTDLICTIVSKMTALDSLSAKNLITCGIYFCMGQQTQVDFSVFLLKQWSVIFSYVSILNQYELFDRLTQLIINKYDLFFLLMKFVRLDDDKRDPNVKSYSDDILEIMTSHLKKAIRKGKITSSMFLSISTILCTYRPPEDLKCIKRIEEAALPFTKKNSEATPGAIDLIVTLFRFSNKKQEEKEKFFEEKVYPLARFENGIFPAARSFRTMMFNHELEADYLFFVWAPTERANSLAFLKWDVPHKPEKLTKIFLTYFFPSLYFEKCSSIFTQIIVKLASMDFKNFIENIFPKFADSDIDSPQFKLFLSIVPMINDKQFVDSSEGVSKEDVESFNSEFAKTTNKKLRTMINSLQGYDLHINDTSQTKQNKSNKVNDPNETVKEASKRFNIDIGEETIYKKNDEKLQEDRKYNSNKLVQIIPYLVNSSLFLTKDWMEGFVRLAALADSEVSIPAYSICKSIFQQDEQRIDFMNVLINMSLQIDQRMEILYICISMLIEISDLLESRTPEDDDAYEYNIEFIALIGFASNLAPIRSKSFELLIRANKLLQSQGLYSEIEDHIPAIASNVNHNILRQKFPKRPGKSEYYEDVFSFETLLYSNYQEPWLFFLAEFGRIIIYSKYAPMLKRIKEFCKSYVDHAKKINNDNLGHLDLGLLVLFISSCIINKNFKNSLFVYEIPVKTAKQIESFQDELGEIIEYCFKEGKYNLIFKSLKHVNYTIVPFILDILKNILLNAEKNKDIKLSELFINILPSLHLMLCSIEGTQDAINSIKRTSVEIYLIVCSNTETIKSIQKLIDEIDSNCQNELTILCFLSFINFCMEHYAIITKLLNSNFFIEKKQPAASCLWKFICDIMNLNDKEKEKLTTIKTYGACALQTIINNASQIILQCKEPEIKIISNCERYGYKVLCPLLKLNTINFFKFFLNSCFRRKGLMADAFFSAIYETIFSIEVSNPTYKDFFNNKEGELLLLGLLRYKTGYPLAKDFLEKFVEIFHHKSTQNKEKVPIDEILKDPENYFERIAEQFVKAALEQMKNKKFKGAIKIIVDILKKWIVKFRLLPNQNNVIPLKVLKNPYSPQQFLNDLMEVTIQYQYNHDFPRIVDIWATLLKVKDNQYTVPVFITEYSSYNETKNDKDLDSREKENHTEIKSELFNLLLDVDEKTTRNIILKTLSRRCKFAFYAYITYQKKKDMDNEFWFVDVLVSALKKSNDHPQIENFLPELIQFAILFHSNQTQSLLKRLCKNYEVLYSRRTLATASIRNLVTEFYNIICSIDEKRDKKQEEMKKYNESSNQKNKNLSLSIQASADDANKPNLFDKSSLFYFDDKSKPPRNIIHIQRAITPTTISKPFNVSISRTNSLFVSDNEISPDSLPSSNASATMTTTTDDDESDSPPVPFIKRSTGVGFLVRSKSNPPPKKKKKPLKIKWAKEAMRWTIGTQNLRIAYMSLIILNSLGPFEIDGRIIEDLLLGVCKSAAYFLSIYDQNEDKSSLYDFIDEAFKLFNTHFEGHELISFDFIKSFLSFAVSVDAYFENLLPLFEKCLSSKITESDAQHYVLAALQPYFNELESDATARKAFDNFEKKATTNAIDIKFVKIVLRRTKSVSKKESDEEDEALIEKASNEQLNRAIQHYSLMIGNASDDLKRRIFTISTKIILKVEKQRSSEKKSKASKELVTANINKDTTQINTEMEINPIKPDTTTTTTTEELNTAEENQEDAPTNANKSLAITASPKKANCPEYDFDKTDLNAQALPVIFKEAADCFPSMVEALNFVQALSNFYPLVPTVPPTSDFGWADAADVVIKSINEFAPKETMTVSLVNFSNLSSLSSLLNVDINDTKAPPIKVLPFSSVFDNTSKTNFDDLANTVLKVATAFKNKIMNSISPKGNYKYDDHWNKLEPPKSFINDFSYTKGIPSLLTVSEFLALEDK